MSSWKKISKAEKVKEVPKFHSEELKLSKKESNNDLSTTVSSLSSGVKWQVGDIFIPQSLEESMEVKNKYRRQMQEKLIQILQSPIPSEEEAVPDAYEESILVEACKLGI